MRRRITPYLCLAVTWVVTGAALAQDTGATGNGNWENPATWTTGKVPGPSNNVYIGSTNPPGAAATATVTLTANESAPLVELGFGSGTKGSLNLGNNALTINGQLGLGFSGGTGVLQEGVGGSFTAPVAHVYSGNALSFGANDAVRELDLLSGSTATTAATGNVTAGISIASGGVLHLGADLKLPGSLEVRDAGSSVDAGHFGITVGELLLVGTSPASLINAGAVRVDSLSMSVGSTLTLHGGDVINGLSTFDGGSVLTVQQTDGTGLTFGGPGLNIVGPNHLDLVFASTGWDFRWQDPSIGGNWISTIDGLIGSGAIVLDLPSGFSYQVVDQGGYTYINGISGAAVPEPSSLVLAAMAAAGIVVWRRWPRSRPRR